jgi:ABC-2 type transport system permease protein
MESSFTQAISLYFSFCKMSLKTQFMFRIDAVLRAVAVFIREITNVLIVYLILIQFPDLGGWNLNEMLFLFSFIFLTYSILIAIFTGFRDFEEIVYTGALDRYLIRPRGIMFQLIASQADYLATIGHGAVGIILFLKASSAVGIDWTLQNVLYLLIALIGGVLIQGAIFIFFSCLNLWFVRTGNIFDMLFYNTRRFAGYPLSIFPKVIQQLLIFVVPFAFVNYFPAQFFLHKADMNYFWNGFMYLSPLVALLLFTAVSIFWHISLKKYTSTGN